MSQTDLSAFRALQSSLLAAAVTSATLYGACLTLGVITVRRLLGLADLPRRTFWIMTSIVVVVVLLYTVLNISVLSLLYSFLRPSFSGLPSWTIPAIFVSVALSLSIGDGIFIYRCWIIWGRSRWVCVPLIIFVAELGTSFYSLIASGNIKDQQQPGGDLVNMGFHGMPSVASETGAAAVILTLSLNTLLAVAAIMRLLHARRQLRSAVPAIAGGGAHYVHISRLLALSTLLYAGLWVPLVFWYRSSNAAPYFVILIAFTAAMPLVVMLQVGGNRDEMKYVLPPPLPVRDGGENEPGDSGLPFYNGDVVSEVDDSARDACRLGSTTLLHLTHSAVDHTLWQS